MPTNNPMSSVDICERLTRTVPNTVNGRGTGLPDKLVNPDGPEAAAIISKLEEALERIANHFDMDGYEGDAWRTLALEMAEVARAALNSDAPLSIGDGL